jgi:hypothetical protein
MPCLPFQLDSEDQDWLGIWIGVDKGLLSAGYSGEKPASIYRPATTLSLWLFDLFEPNHPLSE